MTAWTPTVALLILASGLGWLLLVLVWALPRAGLLAPGRWGIRVEVVGLLAGLGSFSLVSLLLTGYLSPEDPVFAVAVGTVLLLVLLLAGAEVVYWQRD